ILSQDQTLQDGCQIYGSGGPGLWRIDRYRSCLCCRVFKDLAPWGANTKYATLPRPMSSPVIHGPPASPAPPPPRGEDRVLDGNGPEPASGRPAAMPG